MEADRLRSITSAGARGAQTKIVALGIGDAVNETELVGIASAPKNNNIIRVEDFSSLSTVEDKLRISSCTRTNNLQSYNISRYLRCHFYFYKLYIKFILVPGLY